MDQTSMLFAAPEAGGQAHRQQHPSAGWILSTSARPLSWSSWTPQATNSGVMAWPGGLGLGSAIPSFSSCLPSDLLANQLSPKPFRFWFEGSQRVLPSNGCHREASTCVQSHQSTHSPPSFPHGTLDTQEAKETCGPSAPWSYLFCCRRQCFRSLGRGQHSVTHTLNTFKNITINDSRKLQMWSLLPQLHPLHLQNMESSPKSPLTDLSYPFASDSQSLAPKRHPLRPMISCQRGGGEGGHGYYKEPVHPRSLFMKFCLLARHVGIFHSDHPPEIVSISFPFQEAAVDVS